MRIKLKLKTKLKTKLGLINKTSKIFLIALVLNFFSLFPAWAVPQVGQKFMISSVSPQASEAAKKIYQQGGNVVDAAIVAVLCMSVTSPYYAALGGGGLALVHMNAQVEALDFREAAPLKSSARMFMDAQKDNQKAPAGLYVGIPGMVKGLWDLHQKYGKLPWKKLFQEPIHLAQTGFQVGGEWQQNIFKQKDRMNEGSLQTFFKKDKSPYLAGETLKQPGLAKALSLIANRGEKAFYQQEIARDLVDTIQKSGGILSLEDLKKYKTRWLKPIEREFMGYQVYLMPPPSSAGVVISTALDLTEKLELQNKKILSSDELLGLAQTLKLAFSSRFSLGDPDFVQNPTEKLISREYLQKLFDILKLKPSEQNSKIESLRQTVSVATDNSALEHPETTHLSVMDSEGHSVAMTVSLNGMLGSAITTPKYQIALNDTMDDFNTRPGQANQYGLIQDNANAVAPMKRPLSSMSPTIVKKDSQVVLTLGSPGGPQILSSVFQVLYRKLVNKLDIDLAIQTPRIHHQFKPDYLYVDQNKLSPDVLEKLEQNSYKAQGNFIARVYAVSLEEHPLFKKKMLFGAFDSRGEGLASGY